jgi:hypothetical protein
MRRGVADMDRITLRWPWHDERLALGTGKRRDVIEQPCTDAAARAEGTVGAVRRRRSLGERTRLFETMSADVLGAATFIATRGRRSSRRRRRGLTV